MNSTFDFSAQFDIYQDLLVRETCCRIFHVLEKMTLIILMQKNLQTNDCVDVKVHTFLDGVTHVPVCGDQLKTKCMATCHNNSAFNHLLQEAKDSHSDTKQSTYQFYLFLWAAIISWIGMAVVVSIGDAICFDLLGLYSQHHINNTDFVKWFLLYHVLQVTRGGTITGNRRCGAASVSAGLV